MRPLLQPFKKFCDDFNPRCASLSSVQRLGFQIKTDVSSIDSSAQSALATMVNKSPACTTHPQALHEEVDHALRNTKSIPQHRLHGSIASATQTKT
mmetsp:Transcript_6600/g.17738  ORF Transcript_6600/g.17738 Transcript_6600/m.17738 type:complete len:96 (+) Transcript_6600:173-460(+)